MINKFDQILEERFKDVNPEIVLQEQEGGVMDSLRNLKYTVMTALPGGGPENKWGSKPDASNVYYLDPRGNSTKVVEPFRKAMKAKGIVLDGTASSGDPEKEWAETRAAMIIEVRQGGNPSYCTIQDLGRGTISRNKERDVEADAISLYIDDAKKDPRKTGFTDRQFEDEWGRLERVKRLPYIRAARENISQAVKSVNFVEVHNKLKRWFSGAGVYCGTAQGFEVFAKGRMAAAGQLVKGVGKGIKSTLDLFGKGGF